MKKVLATIATIATLYFGFTGCSTTEKTKVESEQHKKIPVLEDASGKYIDFKDNNAVGMTAYAVCEDKKVKLVNRCKLKHSASFVVPREVRDNMPYTFEVYAVDREGNKSETVKIYNLESVLSTTPFEFN